ncbi:CamS family sex pheromone protein [Exiguobacterium profundum]|jgi:protein involved in sex pheromone biosynthesis|uniref:CamS sex pheromone cAM373 family protein n=1 Tax=Exiguobacterium sp. (strain ATCC BAA-1283 / AT1b) TaxID=360911 RepID=C4L2B4_EXISA|nr:MULTISPECIES: CamS family sex pheromone protein [Exiguobacterium]MCC9626144.1 CamS family sex pheromone protein [Thalassospira sp. MA62]ACQ71166.1 CamS sex pheromone cAM373 family protein [Exiguobacterium sp. AT1b]MBQ6460745.1 CamS family sex pheromone protein [Exiguobacterium sp.]MCT4798155.1 CamS family sex pheromone protein [Exiguobacterium profundum]QUP86714.1 CamS family sex pheromone protein [Exiguobacterium sp. PFWT01]
MKWKQLVIPTIASALLLSGCSMKIPMGEEEATPTGDETAAEGVTQAIEARDSYYQMVIPFKPAAARGLAQRQVSSSLELEEVELGLMRHSTDAFDPEKFAYQEGQLLNAEDVSRLLARKDKSNEGLTPLNPAYADGKAEVEDDKFVDANKKSPLYLASIVEQNYMTKEDSGYQVGGVSFALILNREYVFQAPNYGPTYTVKLDQKKVIAEGERMANELVSQLRKREDFKDLDINVALYMKSTQGSPTPGNYIKSAFVGTADQVKSGDWKAIDEKYYYFPSTSATSDVREDAQKFTLFSDRIADLFPDYSGMIGKGFYQNGDLSRMEIDIPIQFYSRAELVGFTQHVVGLLENRWEYSRNVPVRINVTSLGGDPEVTIVFEDGMDSPKVYF